MRDVVVIVLLTVGCASGLTGAVGILRMPDVYTRIQCSTKVITTGAVPVLAAVVVGQGINTTYASRALILAFLLLLLNPVSSHALARAADHRGVPMWDGAVLDQELPREADEEPRS